MLLNAAPEERGTNHDDFLKITLVTPHRHYLAGHEAFSANTLVCPIGYPV